MIGRKKPLAFFVLSACALALLFVSAGNVMGAEARGFAAAKAAQERHTEKLLDIQGVVGTAIGMDENGLAVVQILTERRGVAKLPAFLDGVPVKPMVTGKLYAQSSPTDRFPRPVPIGVSSGTERLFTEAGQTYCSVGTLGARVTNGTQIFALSNNHVYANENDAQVGDRILQPGRVDMTSQGCGSAAEINESVIGTLHSWVQIQFGRRATNQIDAAIALTTAGQVGTATPEDGYGAPSSTPVDAFVGQPVQKYGRTTGLTLGTVVGVNASVLINYSAGVARFVNQVVIQGSNGPFSQSGDSGSLIVTQGDNAPVALLFAGGETITIGNPISQVLGAFGVTIDTGGAPIDTPPQVAISSPAEGATVSGSVTVTANASDDNGVEQVEFFVDGASIGVDFNGSDGWSVVWNTTAYPDGTYSLAATATDTAAQTASDGVDVTVKNTPQTELTVSSIAPDSIKANTTISVTITGAGFVGKTKVTFENGAGPIPTVSNIVVVNSNTITANVWVLRPGLRDRVWDLRVQNPGGKSAVLPDALTVTQ